MIEKFYIGSYSDSIIICEFENGNLRIINNIITNENPSYLNVNNNVLYAVSETKNGSISSFKIVGDDLEKINSITIDHSLPCFISTNIDRTKLLTSNFGDGSISMYNLKGNGEIDNLVNTKTYDNAHIHFSEFSKSKIFSIDLGNDSVYIYNNNLDIIKTINTPNNSGPRHAIILDNYLLVVTELSNQLLLYTFENENIKLIQKISTTVSDTTSYAGAIKISKDHKFIYVTNRGENTISVFSFINNKLDLIQSISCFGNFPRDISFNETEEYLIVANQKSNNLTIFKRNLKNGSLSKFNDTDIFVEKPSCIVRSKNEI